MQDTTSPKTLKTKNQGFYWISKCVYLVMS